MRKTVQIVLDDELYEKLCDLARATHCNHSAVVRLLIAGATAETVESVLRPRKETHDAKR